MSLESEGVCVQSPSSFVVRSGQKNSRSDFETDQAHWPYGGYLKFLFEVESFQRKLDPELPLSTYTFCIPHFSAKISRDLKFSY